MGYSWNENDDYIVRHGIGKKAAEEARWLYMIRSCDKFNGHPTLNYQCVFFAHDLTFVL
jgi:hypothetical protein